MSISRRKFLGWLAAAGSSAVLSKSVEAATNKEFTGHPGSQGVLFDSVLCIGCRNCEAGCNKVNGLPAPDKPFDDLTVMADHRRTDAKSYTVVNKYESPNNPKGAIVPKNSMQPLLGAGMRIGLFCARFYENPHRCGHIQRICLCRMPVLHDCLSLRNSDL